MIAMTSDKAEQADSWVTVYEPMNQADTAVITALLQDAGFTTYVRQETIGVIYGLSVGTLGAEIQVPTSQQEAAEEFLTAHFAALSEVEDESDGE
jgi:ABC-type methionine transport system ATPase subunit